MNRQDFIISKHYEQLGAQSLLMNAFSELDITPEDMGDDTFYFAWEDYEGKTVYITTAVRDDNPFIRLSYYGWYEVSKWNAEEVEALQKKIMEFNDNSRYKFFYRFEDDDYMLLGVAIYFPLFAGICDMTKYVENQIDGLLYAQRDFDNNVITNRDTPGFVLSKPKYDIVVEALKNIQCEPIMMPCGRYTHWLRFLFQAVTFEMYIKDSQKSVVILDRSFYDFRDDKTGKKEMIRDIVNEINSLTTLTVTYSEHKGYIMIGSKYALPCFEDSYFNDLLAYILNEFFYVRNRFYSLLARKYRNLRSKTDKLL